MVAAAADNQLLLPDDDSDFSERIECLGQWCQGFLAGFAAGGKERQAKQGQQQYSAEVSEALSDIAAISQIGLGDDEAPEQSETDFFEITEYVRLAALTIYLDCQPVPAGQAQAQPPAKKDKLAEAVTSVNSLFGASNKKNLH